MIKTRTEVPKEDQWNVESLYPSIQDWQKELQNISSAKEAPHWPEISRFRGTLGDGPARLKNALDRIFYLDRQLSKLYTYAHLKHDEDIAQNEWKVAFSNIFSLINEFQQEASWFEPELLSLPDNVIQSYLKAPELKEYRFHLEKIFRMKPYTLSPEKELLMAMSGKSLQATYKAFSAINDADFKFGQIQDGQGNELELSHARYAVYLRSQDRKLRENAFKTYHRKFKEYENTLAELINGQVQSHLFNAKARGFSSCLEAALYPKNIDQNVYHALIQAVHENIAPLHRYLKLRSRILHLKPLHCYDLQVPLTPNFDLKIPYKEAEDLVIASSHPLGSDYLNTLKQGLQNDRWVDRFENKNKRSGAYSSGCYDSMPYILMNYKDIIRDVFTLAHEAGHSMHSYYSRKNQSYPYSDYSIFVAEVASTFNEELLTQTMLKNAKTKEEKIFLINQKIEDIRATLFRQTMFAEFELFLHQCAENNIPITPEMLNDEYRKLNQLYFGTEVELDPEIDIEWARIPHFYYNFYVFQYATGISAALALAERVLKGGAKEREDYLNFLKSGSSLYPLDTLQLAGVDMRSSAPVKAAIDRFSSLVDELEILLEENQKEKAKLALK